MYDMELAIQQNVTKESKTSKGEVKWTNFIAVTFVLFKVDFDQLINKLSFMRNYAVSSIEKQSCKQAFKKISL